MVFWFRLICLNIRGDEIADVRTFAIKDILVEVLLPVDVVNAGLDFLLGFEQGLAFLVKESLAGRDGGWALQAEIKVVFHFLDAHAAALEAGEVFDPFDIAFIEDAAVIVVAFDVGDKAFIAVVFQGLIGHIGFFADLHHGIHCVFSLFGEGMIKHE